MPVMLGGGSSEKLSRCYLGDQLLVGGECDAPYWTIQGYQDLNDSLTPNSSSNAQYTCGLNISGDGKKIYCGRSSPIPINEITLNNGALSGSTIVAQSWSHLGGWGGPCEVVWNTDGTIFYLSQNGSGSWTRAYQAQTQWSMTGGTQIQNIGKTICSRGRYLDTVNGEYAISMGPGRENNARLSTWKLGTAWDVSSDFTLVSYNNIGNTSQGDGGIFFNADGKHMYIGDSQHMVSHYKLSTPRDVSTCTLVERYNWSDFGLSNNRGGGVVFYGTNMYLWNNKTLKRYKVTYNG